MKEIKKPVKCQLCKNNTPDFTTVNGYGGLNYICSDCSYEKGYISGYGVITRLGEDKGLKSLWSINTTD